MILLKNMRGMLLVPLGAGRALSRDAYSENLSIHEDAEGNVFVKDLTVVPVSSADQVFSIVEVSAVRERWLEFHAAAMCCESFRLDSRCVQHTKRR